MIYFYIFESDLVFCLMFHAVSSLVLWFVNVCDMLSCAGRVFIE